MDNCFECKDEPMNCHTCEEFETYIAGITDISKLKYVRKNLMIQKPKIDDSINGKIADWLTDKVGTMWCFYVFIVLATVPVIEPKLMSTVGYFSSGYLQLILLPLIVVAGNRTDIIREQKNEREWKINVINDRIDELNNEENIKLQQIEIADSMNGKTVISSED